MEFETGLVKYCILEHVKSNNYIEMKSKEPKLIN